MGVRTLALAMLLTAVALFALGCGQKGPLTLPEPPAEQNKDG